MARRSLLYYSRLWWKLAQVLQAFTQIDVKEGQYSNSRYIGMSATKVYPKATATMTIHASSTISRRSSQETTLWRWNGNRIFSMLWCFHCSSSPTSYHKCASSISPVKSSEADNVQMEEMPRFLTDLGDELHKDRMSSFLKLLGVETTLHGLKSSSLRQIRFSFPSSAYVQGLSAPSLLET